MFIDGKNINEQIGEFLKRKIFDFGVSPKLGILYIGNDPASLSFINVKKKFGEKWGFTVNICAEPGFSGLTKDLDDFKQKTIQKILELQKQNDAVIVQLPLPKNLTQYTEEILSMIDKSKDVDNLNNGNFKAPIVLALQKVFMQLKDFDFKNAKIGIVGLGQVVGMPIKNFLEEENYNLEIIKKDEFEKIKTCDVVISGVGKPYLIEKKFIKPGSVLIDYGCSFVGGVACGDFDPECSTICSYFTPVPGCMGPLVVACLFENVLKSAIK